MHFCADTNTVSDQIGLLFGVDCLEEVVDVFDVDYISKCSHGYGFFFFFFGQSGLCCFLKDGLHNCIVPRLGWHLLHS